jgi:hypothetical protein
MKYKLTYTNQWGYKHTKTIKAESQEEASAKALEYVKTTEYEYAVGALGHSEIISVIEQDGGAE